MLNKKGEDWYFAFFVGQLFLVQAIRCVQQAQFKMVHITHLTPQIGFCTFTPHNPFYNPQRSATPQHFLECVCLWAVRQ